VFAEKNEFWRWREYVWKTDEARPDRALITAGVDIGSVSSKAAILADDKIHAYSLFRTGFNSPDSAVRVMNVLLEETGLKMEDIGYVIGTGYGRVNVPFAHKTVTEISCHARGAHFLNPAARTILDMGGQDCKVISCDARGRVVDFLMNDKCAAGTGRGLEVMADLLEVPIAEIGRLSLEVDEEPPPISSTCVVFAKTEAVGLLREGWSLNQVLAAYCEAMAARVVSLLERIGMKEQFVVTGGISKNIGVVKRIERRMGITAVKLEPDPQLAGAFGAAVYARDLCLKKQGQKQMD